MADSDRRRARPADHLARRRAERPLIACIDAWAGPESGEAECDAVAADRQAQLSEPPAPMRASGPSPPVDVAFTEYLYEPSPGTDHPVLAAIAAAAARIRRDRDRVAARIAES